MPADELAARVRDLRSRHEAGVLPFEDFVSAVDAIASRDNHRTVIEALGFDLFWRFARRIHERNPEHWVRGLGDGGMVEELGRLSDTQDVLWKITADTPPEERARLIEGTSLSASYADAEAIRRITELP